MKAILKALALLIVAALARPIANDMQGTPYERPESLATRATLND